MAIRLPPLVPVETVHVTSCMQCTECVWAALLNAGHGSKPPLGRETDTHRLEQRQRQITYGKNTLGYANYRKAVPKCGRAHALGCLRHTLLQAGRLHTLQLCVQSGQEASG